ncbi:hypothetical protein PR202_ga15509 [Eleusine coracana subsp. coracana]|uniref:25S rRNA (uridine-N(3))-methyltransferase BMT5-like domain-containing protein n=1 Tax=Eleusine coracana subsp. coracana TaxID=191504 RepID=A0AAV5CJV2_ELECO|nr:hypothetical protein PR202_ga15509 [Eleusine coracana subsp. coracana]
MPAGVAQPTVGHAVAVIGGAAGSKAPFEVIGKDGPPPAEKVPIMGAAEPVEGNEAEEDDGEEDDEEEEEVGDGEGHGDGVEEEEEEAEAEEEEEEEEDEEEEGEKWLKHYSSMQSILLVGDGDFSFSLALATAFHSGANLVATSLDTYEDLKAKYSKVESNIAELKRLGTRILHGVDVKTMRLHPELKSRRFDRVVFNFPHSGFKGRENEARLIKLHKKLVRSFFCNAFHMLRPYGEIHVSHKMGEPYDRWSLECLAAEQLSESVHLLAHQEQPWYMQRTIADPPRRVNYSYFDRQLCLGREREHEMQRRATMPLATDFICSSAFLEDRSREYVQKQEWLC